MEARTITFYNYKMVEVSTPTIKGHSAIEKSFKLGTQEYWCVECPNCHKYHFITFDDIKMEYHRIGEGKEKQFIVDSAVYVCPSCRGVSSENEIKRQPKKWIARNPEAYQNGVRSFWINSFSSPWMSWKKICLKFLEAKDDPRKLKTVRNTLFGELWEEQQEIMDEDELMGRREEYDAELPDGVLCLTCGVDTQDDRLEYEVVGYGLDRHNWGIEKGYIFGKPSDDEVWERLDGIIDRVWQLKNGRGLKISVTFVDSGGHYTQEVYEKMQSKEIETCFCHQRQGRRGDSLYQPAEYGKNCKEGRSRWDYAPLYNRR